MHRRYTRLTLLRELALVLAAGFFCLPFYLVFAIALETTAETVKTPLSLPASPQWGNFSEAWHAAGRSGLGGALVSSLVITVSSVVGLIVLGSLGAYAIARRRSRLNDFVYILFVLGIILPFQLAIIPLYVAMGHLGLVGNYAGLIVLNIGLLMPLTVFLYTGFIRALPRDYEEAARVDGAGILQAYVRVVFPLLLPITGTVAVLTGIIVWNEFFVALLFLLGSGAETLPVALYSLYIDSGIPQWNLLFAGVAITLAPILAFYLFAQRHLIRGFATGIKG